jgi:hypothetical protein
VVRVGATIAALSSAPAHLYRIATASPAAASGHSGVSARPDTGRSPLTAVSSRYEPAAESRSPRCESGFCQFRPGLRRSGLTPNRGKLCRQPAHSHSIVSSRCKQMKIGDFVSGRANFTVRSTVKKCCLGVIEGDRCRRGFGSQFLRVQIRIVSPTGLHAPRNDVIRPRSSRSVAVSCE